MVTADSKDQELAEILHSLVPAAWLPVSRRLPIPERGEEEEEFRFRRNNRLESVDMRLKELLDALMKYRFLLQSQLAERYKEFEREVLRMILFNKESDNMGLFNVTELTDKDQGKLIQAFQAAGLLDSKMRQQIAQHFQEAKAALKRMRSPKAKTDIKDIFILPLIGRTKSMVELSRQLELYKESLFKPITVFESIVNSYFASSEFGKTIKVDENGNLEIKSRASKYILTPSLLSSGEKQILILLIQAIISGDSPLVYVVDEPELSLHVKWQETLLQSLVSLAARIQLIVATHSPDIIGPYREQVIDLADPKVSH